ncbi:Head-to-tail stopper [Azospirillaceae bacterium]
MNFAQLVVDAAFRQFGAPAVHIAADGTSTPIRVIAKRPDAEVRFDALQLIAETASFEVRTGELATVNSGDVLTVDGTDYVIKGGKRLDPDRLIWTIDTYAAD